MPRPARVANLFRDGWENSARETFRRVRYWNSPMALYAKPDGTISGYIAGMEGRQHSAELIATYTSAAQINEIEDDLIEYLRDLVGRALERKAA